ncbi:hypothetical protein N7509_007098 [Penicillium cosmopolitanum]|uniref:Zn(2)-C6 fungal-type domain-containing protein n=1 Tax=Penicillium cosmopolitanum TaxID=1131564 RepID=A0A9W9VY55_9EURO|nr:uncharacterized protein N7509_007098 [Penicillium cosmopolitanum]KAJ5391608.1 hypothetical protein N7509_007098 [Penicillium cosmopolitanum]
MSSWSDTCGPPRKRMRKGTKSCIECRRRKIRCTYTADHPNVCNECRLRGSKCVDQEHNEDDRSIPPGSEQGEQRYSLRERVAQLENVVQDLVKRLDQQSTTVSSPADNPTISNTSPASAESDKLGPSSIQIQNAPVMQLFDNYLVSRQEDLSSNDQFAGIRDMSPKARAVRAELLSLLPPQKDIWKIVNEGSKLWCVWEESFPEIQNIFDHKWDSCEGLVAPADIGKAIVCLCMSALQSPKSFDFKSLLVPIEPEEFSIRLTEAVDRLVVRDDDFAATLPGIECQMLLAKFHLNEGRLRKAWLVTRRAIEFAHLAAMHLSTRTRSPLDTLFVRRQKIWCSLNCSDRSLSLILGLPYGVTEANFLPQIQQRLKEHNAPAEEYLFRIGVICGHMVDRNQNPADMCLETTLKLDSELDSAWRSMPSSLSSVELGPDERQEQFHARIPLQFMPKVLRALLHLPLMLKYPYDSRFAFSQRMAIKSAREALAIYKVLRAMTRSYLCKMIDFLAFTMGMLLIVHLYGDSDEFPEHNEEEDESDWRLVGEVVDILHQARQEKGGSVAAESSNILGEIYRTRSQVREFSPVTCKITVPYFGTITVGAGAKFPRPDNKGHQDDVVSGPSPESLATKPSPNQLYTPPLSVPEGMPGCHSDNTFGANMPVPSALGMGCPPEALPGDGFATTAFPGPELNAFTGLFDDFSQFSWPAPNVDLGLDHGWNLNWFS